MSEAAERALLTMGKFHLDEGLERAAESLRVYGSRYGAWSVSYSGGKDSTSLATVIAWLIETGQVPPPKTIYLTEIDTLVEIPPLHINSSKVAMALQSRGWIPIVGCPDPLERYWVQLLGRGLPPANQQGNWWCTRSMKKAPQDRIYAMLRERHPDGLLTIYGSRIDESDARAERIMKSCTAAGTECGLSLFSSFDDRLAPLVGWRNCAVWDWLMFCCKKRTGIDVSSLVEAYAADDAQQATFDWNSLSDDDKDRVTTEWDIDIDKTARTGCLNCFIAGRSGDKALSRLSKTAAWGHLVAYKRLQPITEELRLHVHRVKNPRTGGAGALKLESRLWALERVLAIQDEVRAGAARAGKPHFDLIPPDDEKLIRELIAAKTFPSNYEVGTDPTPMPIFDPSFVQLEPLAGQMDLF